MSNLQSFTFPELLALLGAAQCIYVLVYMLFRSGHLSRGTLPAIFFLVLAVAFILDAAQRYWGGIITPYDHYQWLFWFAGPPLSVLLIVQIARITELPSLENYMILSLIPMAYFGAFTLSLQDGSCDDFFACESTPQWLAVTGLIMGGISLLTIWLKRDLLNGVRAQVGGRERFWLIMSLIILNTAFLGTMLLYVWDIIARPDAELVRAVLGIAFAYIASTSLLRIYPQAMRVSKPGDQDSLSDDEIKVALRIEKLIHLDKVYQEPSYGRAELSKELGLSESVLSRIVNVHFSKSVPQLLNDERIKDAKLLLIETEAAVKVIAQEAGFNSIASFNRLFKESTGDSPSEFRKKKA